MPNRILIYSFPFFLLVLEWLLRVSLAIDSREFAGPTISAAALGLLLPLTAYKTREYTEETKRLLATLEAVIVPRRERLLVDFVWLTILVSLVVWASSLVFASRPNLNPTRLSPLYGAMISYFVAVVICEIREAI